MASCRDDTEGPEAAAPSPLGLLERERRFVEYYRGQALGNARQAAILAGYAPKSAHVTGSRLLSRANVQRAIKRHEESDEAIMSRIELQRHWSAVTRGRGAFASEKMSDRLRASELMGRSQGIFLDRVETTNLDIDLGSMSVAQLRERLEAVLAEMDRSHEAAGVED